MIVRVYNFTPDFKAECFNCGTMPCVVIEGHIQPNTLLCGPCFFGEAVMIDWENWNDEQEGTE